MTTLVAVKLKLARRDTDRSEQARKKRLSNFLQLLILSFFLWLNLCAACVVQFEDLIRIEFDHCKNKII